MKPTDYASPGSFLPQFLSLKRTFVKARQKCDQRTRPKSDLFCVHLISSFNVFDNGHKPYLFSRMALKGEMPLNLRFAVHTFLSINFDAVLNPIAIAQGKQTGLFDLNLLSHRFAVE